MPTVAANGAELEYIEKGQGEPVVLVHGTLGTDPTSGTESGRVPRTP